MENFLKRYFKGDYVIWVIYLLLVMVSILALYSASSPLIVDDSNAFVNHIIFLFLGFIALIAVYLSKRNYVKFAAWGLLIFAFVMQIVAYTSLGSADHRRISFFGIFDIQPSEIIKFALIVITAYFIDRFQNPDYLQKRFKLFFAIIWLPLLFIIPSNLSTGIIIILPIVLMMMIGSISWKKIGYFIGVPALIIGVFCSIALMIPRETYEKYESRDAELSVTKVVVNVLAVPRVHTWKNRFGVYADNNPLNRSQAEIRKDEQAEYSECAIYDGRDPKLPGNSFWRNQIPQGWSDYIFSIIVEESGIYGAILIILLFVWLLWRAGVLVKKCETVYSAIVIVGVATAIVFQALVHIGVCTRLFPATGQPLPLISKGGTSILVISAFFGLLLRMSCEVEEKSQEPSAKNQDEETVAERSRSTEKEIVKNEISEEKSDEIIEIFENDEIAETTEIAIN